MWNAVDAGFASESGRDCEEDGVHSHGGRGRNRRRGPFEIEIGVGEVGRIRHRADRDTVD